MVEGKFEFVAVHHALATIGLIEIFEKKKKIKRKHQKVCKCIYP